MTPGETGAESFYDELCRGLEAGGGRMVARCWAHVLGVAEVVLNAPGAPDPLGTCFSCHVFGCAAHAEKDRGSGKWLCFTSVAKAAAASAGIGESDLEPQITSSRNLEERFPALAGATVDTRAAARRLAGSTLGRDPDLLADAVGIAHALVPADHEPGVHVRTYLATGAEQPEGAGRTPLFRLLFPGEFGAYLSGLDS